MAVKMADTGKQLSKIQLRALALTIEGYRAFEIAQILDKGERTIERWRASAAFKSALAETKRSVQKKSVDCVADRLVTIQMLAIDAIEKILSDDEEPSRNKLNAARLAGKWSGLETIDYQIENQLDRLQKRMSPHAYQELLIGLSEDSQTSPNGNGRGQYN